MDTSEIRFLGDVQRLVLAPSDILVLTVACPLTPGLADRIKAKLEEQIPGQKVLVLSEDMKIGALAREAV